MRGNTNHRNERGCWGAASILLTSAACSLALDLDEGRACTVDADCSYLAGTGTCNDGRCRAPGVDAGTSGAVDSSNDEGSGESCSTAGCATTGVLEGPGEASSSDDTGVDTTASTTTSAGSESAAESSTGGDPFNPACPPPYPSALAVTLLDDLEPESMGVEPDNAIPATDGRNGHWYIYNDGTGIQDPPADGPVPYPGGVDGSEYAARTSIDGFTVWGAGYGFTLNTKPASNCPYDVSGFDGIQFWAKGNGTWRMQIAVLSTTDDVGGGICAGVCNDHFGINVALTSEWVLHEVAWSTLAQVGWGDESDFDAGEVIFLQWQHADAAPGSVFEILVDDVQLWTSP
ncbi:MAG: hypothetical protein IAG13_17065 [Deltaproteobacteria bacterium]|nr:hypothetical protein [Nannocystaceae bacterium]